MPCGGITPCAPDDYPCWVCEKPGAQHFCIEWDTPIHARCVLEFLTDMEGQIVISHGHTITLDFSLES